MQENKMPKMPVFLIGEDFWENFSKAIETMVEHKMVNTEDTKIFEITDDIKKVVEAANKIGHPKVSENYYDGFREARELGKIL